MLDYRKILGDPRTRKEVLAEIENDPSSLCAFQTLPHELKEELLAFCMGNRGAKVTYDPFFKYIFNPVLKKGRLTELLSLILGEEVEILEIIPTESDRIHEKGSLLIMDILVKLKSGAYANIEIQKIGYAFQGERCACYSSDLLMRQLSRERAFARDNNKKFSYKQLKKVYTIVLMEKSPSAYWQLPNTYIHHSSQKFDSGLDLDLLQEYYMIPLDVFKEIPHNNLSKLEAWLYFIGSDSPKDIYRVIEAYPEFKELYNELLMLRYQLGELVRMYDIYREALQAADLGTVEYMIEEKEAEIEKKTMELQEKDTELQEKDAALQEKDAELQEKDAELQEKDAALQEKDAALKKQAQAILDLQNLLQQQQEQIENLKNLISK